MLQFHKKFELHNFWQEKWQKTEWTKILRTDSVHSPHQVLKTTGAPGATTFIAKLHNQFLSSCPTSHHYLDKIFSALDFGVLQTETLLNIYNLKQFKTIQNHSLIFKDVLISWYLCTVLLLSAVSYPISQKWKKEIRISFIANHTFTRDEFELEFSGSSKPELWRFQAEPSQST